MIAGTPHWQVNSPTCYQSGEQKRLDSVQTKLKDEIYKLRLQGLTSSQKQLVAEQCRLQENERVKNHDIEFNMPPAKVSYQVDNVRRRDFLEECDREAKISGKVAGFVLDQLQEQLDYQKQLTKTMH